MQAGRAGGCVVVVLAAALILSACTSNSGAGSASGNDVSTQAVCAKYSSMTEANGRGLVALLDTAVHLGARAKDMTLREDSKEMERDLQDPEARNFLSALAQSVASNPNTATDEKTQDLFKRVERIPTLCSGLLRAPLTG
jgi:hypothetical protein